MTQNKTANTDLEILAQNNTDQSFHMMYCKFFYDKGFQSYVPSNFKVRKKDLFSMEITRKIEI